MAPATRQLCDYPGCDRGKPGENGAPMPYATLQGLATRAEVGEDLRTHVYRCHELPLRLAETEVAKLKSETAKIEAETARVVADRPVAPATVVQQVLGQSHEQSGSRTADRRDKIPRPQIDKGVSQSDWNFLEASGRGM